MEVRVGLAHDVIWMAYLYKIFLVADLPVDHIDYIRDRGMSTAGCPSSYRRKGDDDFSCVCSSVCLSIW